MNEQTTDWAALAKANAFVLHVPTQVIGILDRYWDGEENPYISPNGGRVTVPVVGLSSGHTFVANEENLVVLAPHEAKFYAGVVKVLGEGLIALVKLGAECEVMPAPINLLLIGALRTQATVLESGHRKAFGGDGG